MKILKRFNRLGKSELYLDMLFFLRFGSARFDSYFDAKFAKHGARFGGPADTRLLVDSFRFRSSRIYFQVSSYGCEGELGVFQNLVHSTPSRPRDSEEPWPVSCRVNQVQPYEDIKISATLQLEAELQCCGN